MDSFDRRTHLIRFYLERDIPMFAPRIPAETLRRLWTRLAHTSVGLLNSSRPAAAIGVSGPTVDRYIDLQVDLGLVRRMRPYHFRTATGDEIDLPLIRGDTPAAAVAVKRSTSPTVSAGYHRAVNLLDVPHRFVAVPDGGKPTRHGA